MDFRRLNQLVSRRFRMQLHVWLVFGRRRCDHINDALISLHWLFVVEQINFKMAVVV
jgi:hypothetical protein